MDVGNKVDPDVKTIGAQKISPYVSRSNALSNRIESSFESHNGCLQSVFNAELEFEGDDSGQDIPEVEILNERCQSTYMMNTLSRRVGYLEQRIVSMEEAIEDMHGTKVHSIASACQDMSLFCGRICCDTEGSRLNPQSVILEGSIAISKGARVRLDLSSCNEYRLFPGQIVAVRGRNPTGFCIVADQMLSTLPFTAERSPATKAFSMVVASGPFTAADNLMYEPLKALIQYCEREKPEMLLLLGPFVDEDHPDIGKGLVDVTFEDIFDVKIMGQLEALHQNTDTKVVLLPSVRDVHHDVTFPQGPLSVPEHSKTISISNPSTIRYVSCEYLVWLKSSCGFYIT